jgi:hypothetical protein
MATANDVITGALRIIGVLGESESASGNQTTDALVTFNEMIESWSIERLSVFCTQDQTFTWTANNRTRTLGPTGDFAGNRPVLLDDSTYYTQNGISYPLRLVNEDQYNSIALKTDTSTMPIVLWANMAMPDMELAIWPVPTASCEVHFVSVEQLTQAADPTTTLVLPPGYLRALKFNLGVELAQEYGRPLQTATVRIAATAKRNLKRINNPKDVLGMPGALLSRRGGFNIFSGDFN